MSNLTIERDELWRQADTVKGIVRHEAHKLSNEVSYIHQLVTYDPLLFRSIARAHMMFDGVRWRLYALTFEDAR